MHTLTKIFVNGSLLIGIIFIIFGAPSTGIAAEKLTIGSPITDKNSPDALFQRLFITEIYRRLGIEVKVVLLLMIRCSYMANEGEIDGETERVGDYNKKFTNLIRVNAMTRIFRFVAFAANPDVTLDGEGWKALKGTPYRVEYPRGTKKTHEKLIDLVNPDNLSVVNTVEQGILKLVKGRTDIFVTFKHWMALALNKKKFQGYSISPIALMEEVPQYHYLHKKHSDLAPKVAEMLEQMKAEGVLDDLLHRVHPLLKETATGRK